MHGTIWSLVPSFCAIGLALLTKEVYSSLFIGIFLGALFAADFNIVNAFNVVVVKGLSSSVSELGGIICFLVILGILVGLVNKSGGSQAFGRWAERNIKSRVGVQIATFILGILIFIDDYFNCLTVGSVMQPVTDRAKVSRAKLAYLIDATAAPVCMIAPISSWAAAVSGVANDLGTGITGIQLFIRAIPYNFYSLLTFVFIVSIVFMKFDYGKMKIAEMNAQLNGDLGGLKGSESTEENSKGMIIDLVLPVVALIIVVFFAMLYAGGYYGKTDWIGDENTGNLIGAFGDTNAMIALPWGGLAVLLGSFIYFMLRRTIKFKEMGDCIPQGFIAMVPSILILIMATTLKTITSNLGAAQFVHDLMLGASSGLYSLLPAVIFVVAIILAFATGTSWGTFGILIPIVTAIFPHDSELLIIGISACLAGAVCGDHCSPISDTTIMSSAGARIEHVQHVSTQLPYALTVAGVSFVTYAVAGFVNNWMICLAVGSVLMIGTLIFIKNKTADK
ncbi:MAG: Na+/H+ antiporter NhaC family protein [Synergistaceae bacterium]|nr:Na+/H+ antiporter NhaC family protein [Synergistaceae bacterium]MBQ3449081.1 Na+/H+ antiporter NhaC family protein [Synergistaceae bacterium]MBQ3693926.1 Na+/H+ antiporter NhaC family protein [Synergistaceae bacterium]MBR0249482.1 Na+/H+ antiporter NhaC family protein [Synergistaceae bacterium]